jgi:hypothetical protein
VASLTAVQLGGFPGHVQQGQQQEIIMNATTKTKPAYRAFTVVKNGHGDSYWHQIGAAWNHEDEKGLSIRLFAVPVDGQVILRTVNEKTEERQVEVPY